MSRPQALELETAPAPRMLGDAGGACTGGVCTLPTRDVDGDAAESR